MVHQTPSASDYKQMIRALRANRDALDKQISALEIAMAAQEALDKPQKKQRNRPKTLETLKLEGYVQEVFSERGTGTMKLIDVIRETIRKYPENERITEQDMRAKFHNLKKSKFILPVEEPYGHIRLAKPVSVRNVENTE